jgi:hypothetical protein
MIPVASSSFSVENAHVVLRGSGIVRNDPYICINVDSNSIIGSNALSLGFQLDCGSLGLFQNLYELRQLAEDGRFRLVRFFDGRQSPWIPTIMPCKHYDEASQTGTYDWTVVDDLVGKIFEIGAEPLICLGIFKDGRVILPEGMATDLATGLPNPASYASYCAEWVKHFKAKEWDVKFYEVINEPWAYFGSGPKPDQTKLAYYMQLFAECRSRMKQEGQKVIVSFDYIWKKPVLDYWLANNGPDVDSMNFHKYDDWKIPPQYTDDEMFVKAEILGDSGSWYSINGAAEVWYQHRGKRLLMICSESNLNAAWSPTCDLRMQQMTGAVWLALVLRQEILSGVSYHVFFELADNFYNGSYGFGMVDSTNETTLKPWYSYYVQEIIGSNLKVGDILVKSTETSDDVRSLAWIHESMLTVLLICKTSENRTVWFTGIKSPLSYEMISSSTPWENPVVKEGMIGGTEPIELKGYMVILMRSNL